MVSILPLKKFWAVLVVVLVLAQGGCLATNNNELNSSEEADSGEESTAFNLDEFRLCRISPSPVLGQPKVETPELVMALGYQCAGDVYNQFATLMEQVIEQRAAKGYNWGKRSTILASSSEGNNKARSILIMGNSHTRQLTSTLLCQYKDEVVDSTMLYPVPEHPLQGVLKVQMKHNLIVYAVTNSPFFHSLDWDTILLENTIQQPLSSMDAIILGNINGAHKSAEEENDESELTGADKAMAALMTAFQETYPELTVDGDIPGPTVKDVADKYDGGPIIYVSAFASRFAVRSSEMMEQVKHETNVHFVDGRRYIHEMKELQQQNENEETPSVYECSSDSRAQVGTCNTDVSDSRFKQGHRCTGGRGGHPDLIAWDVITMLRKIFRSEDQTRY
ncbi:expressed unknown protein [Seminavis robusta]|uniref:Uncharacterized protein n=1 Tax=Seminavis robusta TaxID=568900 RepID=A0A9N8D767_9STRA|nr:expressed unknown protein [Seminavis robusta]|eukprot:Sro5_g003910.1 n/a (392) ;mRNA; r:1983-3158